jgi:HKD family nuclease
MQIVKTKFRGELLMQLINNGSVLNNTLIKLIKYHDNISIAVAWASANTQAFQVLIQHQDKIQSAVIGTHFYQTHPDVLDHFIDCDEVRFVLQPQGVFHPKAYLFWTNDDDWDILIGSANFTNGALSVNTELMLHISSDDGDENIREPLEEQIESYWNQAQIVTAGLAAQYRASWENKQPVFRGIIGVDNGTTMSWQEFFGEVQRNSHFEQRCDLLDLVRREFRRRRITFATMTPTMRTTIAGLGNQANANTHCGCFGAMASARHFKQAVNNNNNHLSNALDLIPLRGAITRQHYYAYIDEFRNAFPNARGAGIGTASRLLAMKRPDYFVCLTSQNEAGICAAFNIQRTIMNDIGNRGYRRYERYWDELICRIMNATWWQEPAPADENIQRVWLGRAAMLDAIYHQQPNLLVLPIPQ